MGWAPRFRNRVFPSSKPLPNGQTYDGELDLHFEGMEPGGESTYGETNLAWHDLRGRDLRSARLANASLQGANLSGVDLSDADLNGANLRGANLDEAILQGADLHGSDLLAANLQGADLSQADLTSALITEHQLAGPHPWRGLSCPTGLSISSGLKKENDAGQHSDDYPGLWFFGMNTSI